MKFKLSKESVKQLRGIVSNEANEFVQEQAEEVISFESNPMEYILNKYPSLNDTLQDLLTNYFRDYITGIFVVAPKPTTFKVLLHNGQMFFLIYGPKSWIAKVAGKRFYLLNLNEEESAVLAISELLQLGRPPGAEGPDETTGSEKAKEEEAPAEEEGGGEEAGGEEAGMTESIKKKSKLIKETPEQIISDLQPLGFKKKDFQPISGKRVKLVVPRKERDITVDKIVKNFSKKGYKQNTEDIEDPKKKYQINTPDGTVLLVKPEEGQGTASVHIELEALAGLLDQIKKTGPVTIKIGKNKYPNIAGGRKVEGTPKADLALTDKDGNDVIFISHKDGDSAKDFQQYGGVSNFSTNPEVEAFAQAVRDNKEVKKNNGVMVRGGGFKRKVKDKKLILQSMYGNEYGGAFGKNNVHIICQGPIKLNKSGNAYELKSNHDMLNGTLPVEGYEAYFMATFRTDRKDMGIKYCRLGIYPVATRPTAQDI